MSRHRGAKLAVDGTLGKISLVIPEYLLSVERRPFHSGPPITRADFSSLLGFGPAVRLACTLALWRRLPTALSQPCAPSVTLWEATAPVKLPAWHGPPPGSIGQEGRRRAGGSIPLSPPTGLAPRFAAPRLSPTRRAVAKCQAAVKVHGVFPLSFRG